MATGRDRGLGKPVPVHAHQARHSGWDPIRGLPLRPADLGSASMRPDRWPHPDHQVVRTSKKFLPCGRHPPMHRC